MHHGMQYQAATLIIAAGLLVTSKMIVHSYCRFNAQGEGERENAYVWACARTFHHAQLHWHTRGILLMKQVQEPPESEVDCKVQDAYNWEPIEH